MEIRHRIYVVTTNEPVGRPISEYLTSVAVEQQIYLIFRCASSAVRLFQTFIFYCFIATLLSRAIKSSEILIKLKSYSNIECDFVHFQGPSNEN